MTNATGARHASFCFVAGELDPMSSRELFLQPRAVSPIPSSLCMGRLRPDAQRQRWRRCEICRTYNPVNCPSASSRSMRNFLPLLPTPFDLLSARTQVGSNTGRLRVGCPLWVISGHAAAQNTMSAYPQKQTCAVHPRMSTSANSGHPVTTTGLTLCSSFDRNAPRLFFFKDYRAARSFFLCHAADTER